MHRPAILALVLFAMFWQSLAMARVGSTVNALADLQHATLHWLGESHHHHEDGTYHLDDSAESVQHVVTDQLNASMGMASPPVQHIQPRRSAAPPGPLAHRVPNPDLDGLLRPPRPRS